MLNLFKKVLILRKALSHADRVAAAQQKANAALTMFTAAHNTLDTANEELQAVVHEAHSQIDTITANLIKAKEEIRMNKAVQEKLQDFIGA